MPQVTLDIQLTLTVSKKEFSLLMRALAGHALTNADTALARELNVRLLQQRQAELQEYVRQSARALEVATEEISTLLAESYNE